MDPDTQIINLQSYKELSMDKSYKLQLKINDIRAIKEANIALDGITVITGENGCGKSTISRLTYTLLKTIIDYDEIVEDGFSKE
jgi:ABC-type Mn2+/Zn2+ transport system ATPase subunit